MITTLARIAGYAAKSIYAYLLLKGGVAHRQEVIKECGCSSSIVPVHGIRRIFHPLA
jgi:hypothetical protein